VPTSTFRAEDAVGFPCSSEPLPIKRRFATCRRRRSSSRSSNTGRSNSTSTKDTPTWRWTSLARGRFRLVRGPKKVLITGAQAFAETQLLFFDEEFHRAELLPWYDHHLKGAANGIMDRPRVRFFVQGEREVRDAHGWPPADAAISELFLSGERSGHEVSLNDGLLVGKPSETTGNATSWSYPAPHWMAGVTTIDKDGVPHHTARVVTFTTPAFERDREFTGQGVLHLYGSSDQADMDVIVKLSLLSEGSEPPVRVSQGWLRASHREEDPDLTTEMRPFLRHNSRSPIAPGQVMAMRIELLPMSVLVRSGERLRLENSNWKSAITEAPMTHWYGQKEGTDTYHHDSRYPSRLRLHERPRTSPHQDYISGHTVNVDGGKHMV
jgi:putative CocE/NonD family hydrolase